LSAYEAITKAANPSEGSVKRRRTEKIRAKTGNKAMCSPAAYRIVYPRPSAEFGSTGAKLDIE